MGVNTRGICHVTQSGKFIEQLTFSNVRVLSEISVNWLYSVSKG